MGWDYGTRYDPNAGLVQLAGSGWSKAGDTLSGLGDYYGKKAKDLQDAADIKSYRDATLANDSSRLSLEGIKLANAQDKDAGDDTALASAGRQLYNANPDLVPKTNQITTNQDATYSNGVQSKFGLRNLYADAPQDAGYSKQVTTLKDITDPEAIGYSKSLPVMITDRARTQGLDTKVSMQEEKLKQLMDAINLNNQSKENIASRGDTTKIIIGQGNNE
ncbi:MAG: hypothetical protein JHC33_04925, partial [Ignisphaera sp.]|nr:hypothetical protein [Ignisphaera sp.]